MSHKHARILNEVFRDPVSGNIHWRDIESLLNHLGAETISSRGAISHLKLNGVEGTVHRPHHGGTCHKRDIQNLRTFLSAAGVTPSLYKQ